MTKDDLRAQIEAHNPDTLPDAQQIAAWASASGMSIEEVQDFYCEVTRQPGAFDPLAFFQQDGSEDDDDAPIDF